MKNSSFIKISAALAIMSLYIGMFGIMDVIEGDEREIPSQAETVSVDENSGNQNQPLELNVINGKMPRLYDYDPPVIPPAKTENQTEKTDDAATSETPVSASAAAVQRTTAKSEDSEGSVTSAPQAENAPSATSGNGNNDLINNDPLSAGNFRISSGGNTIEGDAFDIVARVVQAEIGSAFHKEAIKAQAVTIYTYIKNQNSAGNAPVLPIAPNASERVRECTREVWEQAIYYNGELIQAVYCASSAGYSASAKNVWGSDLPYLKGGKRDLDEQYDPNWGQSVTFSSNEIMTNVLRQTGIQLTGEPSDWLKIQNHVDTVYVGDMSIGGKTTFKVSGNDTKITGRVFRERIMGFALRSASFTFSYDKATDTFTFKTNGYGHGAGLSQNGANILATHKGYGYVDILKHYYNGVSVS